MEAVELVDTGACVPSGAGVDSEPVDSPSCPQPAASDRAAAIRTVVTSENELLMRRAIGALYYKGSGPIDQMLGLCNTGSRPACKGLDNLPSR